MGPFNLLENPCAERVQEAWPRQGESAQGVSFPQGLGSHMDLSWALDTMFHTAALDLHFFSPP